MLSVGKIVFIALLIYYLLLILVNFRHINITFTQKMTIWIYINVIYTDISRDSIVYFTKLTICMLVYYIHDFEPSEGSYCLF